MFKIKINTTPEETETILDFLKKYAFYDNRVHDLQESEFDPKTQSCGIRFTANSEYDVNNILRELIEYGLMTEKEIRNCINIELPSQNPDVDEHSNISCFGAIVSKKDFLEHWHNGQSIKADIESIEYVSLSESLIIKGYIKTPLNESDMLELMAHTIKFKIFDLYSEEPNYDCEKNE